MSGLLQSLLLPAGTSVIARTLRRSVLGGLHQLPCGLGEAARQRRVDGEGVRNVIDTQLALDSERNGQDQLAGARCDNDAAEHRTTATARDQLDEPVAESLHLGPGICRQWQLDQDGVRNLAGGHRLLRDADAGNLWLGK